MCLYIYIQVWFAGPGDFRLCTCNLDRNLDYPNPELTKACNFSQILQDGGYHVMWSVYQPPQDLYVTYFLNTVFISASANTISRERV